jgi:hypothetical protein
MVTVTCSDIFSNYCERFKTCFALTFAVHGSSARKNANQPLQPINARLSYMEIGLVLCNVAICLSHVLRTPSRINEQILTLLHVIDLDLLVLPSTNLRQHTRWCQQLKRVPETDLLTKVAYLVFGRIRNAQLLSLNTCGDDGLDLCGAVWVCWDDEETSK